MVWRAGLWEKLIKHGIQGRCFNVILGMYKSVKSCISVNGKLSPLFECKMGVRQGENLSPILFALFLNDLESFMNNSALQGISLTEHNSQNDTIVYLKLLLLLYADDTVIFADTYQGLQKGLENLEVYCKIWKLTVNVEKTKVMIFENRKSNKHYEFKYDGNTVKMVDSFKYLGVYFNTKGTFSETKVHLSEQATKAMFSLLKKWQQFDIPVDLMLELFDKSVVPILLYGCEVWGFENIDIIERIHLKFCKIILNVKKSTANYMVYGELGRYPLRVLIYSRLIKFWAKIITPSNMNKISFILYQIQLNQLNNGKKKCKWLGFVKSTLEKLGLNEVWQSQQFPNASWLYLSIKRRLQDHFIQEWMHDVSNTKSSISQYYRLFKKSFNAEDYLIQLSGQNKSIFTKLRLSLLKFPVTTGRYDDIPYEQRYCTFCDEHLIGDEFHYTLVCKNFSDLRSEYIPEYFWKYPNKQKLVILLNSKDKKLICKICNFVRKVLKKF